MVRLYTLGALDLRDAEDEPLGAVLAQSKRAGLLAYLALARPRGFQRRDTLLALFWPELGQERARHALRQSLYVLRAALGKGMVRTRGAEELALDSSHLWCDAVAFEGAVEEGRLEEALDLYRGDLFTGFHLAEVAPELEDWIERERTRLRTAAFGAARGLAQESQAAANPAAAAAWTRRALTLAPDDEEALRDLLLGLAGLGDAAGALHAYEDFARRLARDLDVQPSAETRALVERLRADAGEASGMVAGRSAPIAGGDAWGSRRRPRHNVPAEPTPLVGRATEIETARALLREHGARLLTLTGAGGTGKTRLALHLAASWVEAWDDGVWFVPLAAVRDPALVPSAIAHSLPIQHGGAPPLEALKSFLRGRRLLLVVDNFEHLLSEALVVSELLAAGAGVQVLVTSRSRLDLRGEHELPVPPLEVPGADVAPRARALMRYPAVALFVQRARAADPRFRLGADNAGAVVEVCRRLDGLPLALELAAARLRDLSPAALLEKLEGPLELLSGGPRDLPQRHRTLRDTIAWSHELLDTVEQTLFRRLGVFVGGCALDAAAEVCQIADLGPHLELLADKSLVSVIQAAAGDDHSGPRVQMLETIREYALERLEESGEEDAVRSRHSAVYLALAEAAEPRLGGADQRAWMDRLERESGNLRAALAWGLEGASLEVAARIGSALWRFWWVHGHLTEGRRWLERIVAGRSGLAPATRARALNSAAGLAFRQGDRERAEALYPDGLAAAREAGDRRETARALRLLGAIRGERGNFAEALALSEEALAINRELGDKRGVTDCLGSLSGIAFMSGGLARCKELCEESLKLLERLGDRHGRAMAMNNLGEVERLLGNLDRAESLVTQALGIARELEAKHVESALLVNLGNVALDRRDHGRARELYESALRRAQELGLRREVAPGALRGLGAIALAAGRSGRAAILYAGAALLREADCFTLAPSDADRFREEVAATREAAGEEAFVEALRQARRQGPEQLLSIVLDDAP
jgi:non-specific serine/threonine protein kinase